jgi:hypothetical protein
MNVGEFGEENNGWKNRGCDYRENEVDWVGMKFCVPALSLLAMAVARFADQERNIAEPFCVSNDLSLVWREMKIQPWPRYLNKEEVQVQRI